MTQNINMVSGSELNLRVNNFYIFLNLRNLIKSILNSSIHYRQTLSRFSHSSYLIGSDFIGFINEKWENMFNSFKPILI